ncbi:hypothetical protein ABTX82_01665 [Streptomyces lavendulae]|uniref:hypothetical protein n=1 Tax=Streptomyces lavendulae TaxID=1914 RepID=UPI003328F093
MAHSTESDLRLAARLRKIAIDLAAFRPAGWQSRAATYHRLADQAETGRREPAQWTEVQTY